MKQMKPDMLVATIMDGPDLRPTVETARKWFEGGLGSTASLARCMDFAPVLTEQGQFIHYQHRQTDLLWIGFALGLRFVNKNPEAFAAACWPEEEEEIKPQS